MIAASVRRIAGTCAIGLVIAFQGCRHDDVEDRDKLLARADAARLEGAWNLTMVLERPIAILSDSSASVRPVTGSIAFTENRQGEREVRIFGAVTHRGVSDLDLHGFSLPFGHDEPEGLVVARTVPMTTLREGSTTTAKDSVFVLLQSADEQLDVTLSGVLSGDSAVGHWTAEFLRNEASGRFVMSRRLPSR
jgi:hypothetical protein